MAKDIEKWSVLTIGPKPIINTTLKTKLFELKLHHTKDNDEAKQTLKDNQNISTIVLEMVKKDESCALDFIQFVREELNNHKIRIILLTKSANTFLKKEIVQNYEIDAYIPNSSSSDGRIEVAIIAAVRSYKQIINTSNLLKSLGGSIAHEVRNPLNAISMISTQIEQCIKEISENSAPKRELKKLSSMAAISINRANQIIDMTLNDLRSEEMEETNFTKIFSNEILENALKEYSYNGKEEKLKTIFLQDPKNNFIFKGDETSFIYIVFNILKNALYYFKEHPNAKVTISCKKALNNEKYNQIIVEDTGPGIAADKLEEIFKSFTTSGKEGGTGLGLPFCLRAMKSFNGDMKCESKLGKYTKFILFFPILKKKELTTNNNSPQKSKVLIVDDQIINLQITKNIIEKKLDNITCYTAKNGKEAVRLFKKEKHNLIFMDIQMPVMDGYEATKEIKKINKNVPVIAYTSLESVESKIRADKAGIDHYITKPISHNILIRTIDKWLINRNSLKFDNSTIIGTLDNQKVLIADDQEINNILLSRSLKKKFNMSVDTVENGEDLIKKFKEKIQKNKPYDIILTDIHMEPGMCGLEASKEIRKYEVEQKLKYKTPIIAISGDDDQKTVRRFFRNGIDDYQKKGASDHESLHSLMAFWIGERGSRKIQKELLSTHVTNNPNNSEECEYYNSDYDKINLLNQKIEKEELIEIRELFLKCGADLISKIKKCYNTNNIDEFKVHVHSLKGVSGNMGMERLYKFSHNLHEASKEIDVIQDNCMEKLDEVFYKTKEVLGNLK